jgi:hypothetical protein
MNDQLDGRAIVILPSSADGLRGPARTIAITAEARGLSDAIVARLDRIDLFEDEGRLKLLVNGGWQIVTGEVLRGIIRGNCAHKCLVTTATGLAVELRPVEPSELVIRTMLTAPPRDGGLLGRVPAAVIEPPRAQEVAAAAVPPMEGIEFEAGQRALAKHAERGKEQLRQEIEAGQRQLAKLQT